jgi:ribosomal protein S18
MALNVLGRSVKAQSSYEILEDGTQLGRDKTGLTQPLTSDEFQVYRKYMKDEYAVNDIDEDDIPVIQPSNTMRYRGKNDDDDDNEDSTNPDELQLSLKWLTARAQREMDDLVDDNPYSDLMPYDLNPSWLVNRKRAKLIPVQVLHHNNVQFLQKFMTPTGQIKNRVQTRLGARDQRRVAKLIRRARALGLLPYIGQSKAEAHGWIHAPDIHETREWEKELVERGLTIRRSNNTTVKDE